VDARKQPAKFLLIVTHSLRAEMKSTRLDLLRRIQHAHPDDLWANHWLAWELKKNGKPAEAIRYFTAMLALRSDNPGIYLNRGATYRDAGEFDAAIADLRKAVALAPRYAVAHYVLGTALVEKGDLDGARAAYGRAIRYKPTYAHAHDALGVVLGRQGQANRAIAAYRQAIRHEPKYAEAHYSLGVALTRQGKFDQAGVAFREAIRHKADYADAHHGLGLTLLKKERFDEAGVAFRQATRHKPSFAQAQLNLGVVLARQGRLDEASAAFRQAIRHKPKYAEAHYNLGQALMRQDLLDQAVPAFRQAIRHKPSYPEAHFTLGWVLMEMGELDGSIAAFREVIRLEPDHAEAHCNLGIALKRTGQFTEALAAFRGLHELCRRDPKKWPYPSAHDVGECERLIALQARLPQLLRGKDTPAGARECLELAYLCMHKRLRAAAARFFTDAFKASPALAANLEAGDRFGAARAAALAGTGQGKDADRLDDAERARWRSQALAWLRADLQAWGRLLDREPGRAAFAAVILRRRWLPNADLRGVRGREALARLPEAERQPWQQLWDDVARTLARAQGKNTPQKKSAAK
jgi:tetratricopeptide (TPR) repeat protein